MKLLLDTPLSPDVAAWLRGLGHDAVHASEIAAQGMADEDLMRLAAAESRVLVTAGLDFDRLLELWSGKGQKVILLRGADYSPEESKEAVSRGLEAIDREKYAPSIVVVGRGTGGKCGAPE
jgi:predicted nuclease of predicted toxin-antitoxin system